MDFVEWLQSQGCRVEITQEEDNNGYYCLEVILPDSSTHDITVTL